MERKLFGGAVALFFVYMSSSLIVPIAMGAVLAVLFFPWLSHLESKKIPTLLGAALLTVGITVVLLLPSSFLMFFIAKTGFQHLQIWRHSAVSSGGFMEGFLNLPKIHAVMEWVTIHFPVTMNELAALVHDFGTSVGIRLTEFLGGVFTHLPGMSMAVAIIVVSVYFFLVDGPRLVHFLKRHSLFNHPQTEQMFKTLEEMCRSVILASVISGVAQTLLELIGCVVTATPNLALIGSLVFIGSFIPVVGSFPITITVSFQQLLEGNQKAAIILAIFALVISGVDNMIRPLFLKGSTNLHPLLAFVAAFGGLQTFGFLGIFLGPIIAALFVVTLQVLTQPRDVS